MSSTQVVEHALALPETERIELARKLIASVATDRETEQLTAQGRNELKMFFRTHRSAFGAGVSARGEMKIGYHPEFADDINRLTAGYAEVSAGLGQRFRREIDWAIDLVKARPTNAGHLVKIRGEFAPDVRRCNLSSFPFFVLYGLRDDWLVFGSVVPSRSDPLLWLARFGPAP